MRSVVLGIFPPQIPSPVPQTTVQLSIKPLEQDQQILKPPPMLFLLPIEVLEPIFVALNTRSLLALGVTCKTSYMLVFPILNREIHISPRSLPILENRVGSSDPRNLLVCKAKSYATGDLVPFLHVLKGFPHLKELSSLYNGFVIGWDGLARIEEVVGDKLTTLWISIRPPLASCDKMMVSIVRPNDFPFELSSYVLRT